MHNRKMEFYYLYVYDQIKITNYKLQIDGIPFGKGENNVICSEGTPRFVNMHL